MKSITKRQQDDYKKFRISVLKSKYSFESSEITTAPALGLITDFLHTRGLCSNGTISAMDIT